MIPHRAAKRRQSLGPGVSPGSTSPREASARAAKDSPSFAPLGLDLQNPTHPALRSCEEIVIVQCSIVICHFRRRLRRGIFKKKLREAPPSMAYDN